MLSTLVRFDAGRASVAGFDVVRQSKQVRHRIALTGLATILRIEGEDDRALDHCHEALKLFAEADDPHGEAVARIGAGAVWMSRGCYAAAKRWFSDALELSAAPR